MKSIFFTGASLRLYPLLTVLLTLTAVPALAQTEAKEKTKTAPVATNILTQFAAPAPAPQSVQPAIAPAPVNATTAATARPASDESIPVTQVALAPPYSTTATDLAPVPSDVPAAEVAQTDTPAEMEPTGPVPVETRVLGSQARWELGTDLMFLRRDMPDVTTAIDSDVDPISNTSRGNGATLGTGSLDFDLATGARFTASYHPNAQDGYEISFMGLYDWSDATTLVSSGNETLRAAFIDPIRAGQDDDATLSPTNTNQLEDFVQADAQRLEYESDLNSLELNYRYALTPPSDRSYVTLLAGLRYLSVDEGFDVTSFDGATRLGGSVGTYQINTSNDLLGLQIGLDSGVQLTPGLGLGLSARAGLALNFNDQSSTFTNDNGIPTVLSGSESDTSLSPLFQVEGSARWDISDNFTLKTGYQLMALGNIATAPSQFGPLEELGDLERSSVVYHGPFVGLELRF